MGQPITIDLGASRTAYLAGCRNISWTRLQQFERCPASWFAENFAVIPDRQTQRQNHLHAFPGTIIQRIWESVVNDHIYQRPGFEDDDVLAAWCAQQARALFRLTVLPIAIQSERPQGYWRRCFSTPEGEEWRQDAIARHGLDPIFRGHLSPQFAGESDITRLYGSTDDCLAYIGGRFGPTIAALQAAGIAFDQTVAERYIAVDDGDWRLAGQPDFLVRAAGQDQLTDGYRLIDGKFRLGPTVDVGQLYFYALLVERNEGIRPGWLGFLDYGNGLLAGADGDGAYRLDRAHELDARIKRYRKAAEALARTITNNGDPARDDLQELPGLNFLPSRLSCAFCSISDRCRTSMSRER